MIVEVAEIVDMLLQAGVPITHDLKPLVVSAGESFEWYKPNFNPDFLPQTEKALTHLYKVFSVEKVKERTMYGGTSAIVVPAEKWQKQFAYFWDFLVHGSGVAFTVQGEVFAFVGKCIEKFQTMVQ